MSYPSVRTIGIQHREIGDSRRNLVLDFLTANFGDKGSCTPGPLQYRGNGSVTKRGEAGQREGNCLRAQRARGAK